MSYVGRDGNLYEDDGTLIGPSGQAPIPTEARLPPSGNDPINMQANVTQPPPAAPAPAAADLQSGILAPFSGTPPGFQPYGAFQGLTPFQPTTFTQPTMDEALNNPGYKFRVQQGQDSLQNWAAARGTLNDSGTAKALIDYGQNAAQQGYGDVYARDFNTWQANESGRYAAWTGNEGALERAYGLNRQTQSIDPWTAAYNVWAQQGQNYLQNQSTAANTSLGFAQIQ